MNDTPGQNGSTGSVHPRESADDASTTARPDAFGLGTYIEGATAGTEESVGTKTRPTSSGRASTRQQAGTSERVEAQWKTRLGEPLSSGPVVHDGGVFATGRSGRVYALDATDGTERWQLAVGNGRTTRPAVEDGLAFVGDRNGVLRALDATTGTVRWRYDVGGEIEARPVVRDGVVHVAGGGRVSLVDADTGDRRAAFGHGRPAVGAFAVGRETVLLGSVGGGLQARCSADGRERWECVPDQAVVAAPAVADDRAYVATVDGTTLLAVDHVTGSVRERFDVGSRVWGRPAVTDDAAIVADQDGVVSAFDRETGACRWRVELRGSVWRGPTVADGRIYVGDDEGWIYCLDAVGEKRWRFEADAAITTSPAVADGRVVLATEAGTVVALASAGV